MKSGKGAEFAQKLGLLRSLMNRERLKAVYLKSQSNFAWLSCGGESHVALASVVGVAGLLVTARRVYAITNRIEAGRFAEEELRGLPIEVVVFPWEDPEGEWKRIAEIVGAGTLGTDVPLSQGRDVAGLVKPLRYSLHPEEQKRLRALGRDAEEAMRTVCLSLERGMSEYEAAGLLSARLWAARIKPALILVAADQRIAKYRHPVPTARRVRSRAMLVTNARRHGLVVSFTRFVSFGPAPASFRKLEAACARVDAGMILSTQPGRPWKEIFQTAVNLYEAEGYPGEWMLHHQGGPCGYESRDFRATSDTGGTVLENQAVAWNPSITGAKSEDTILAGPKGPLIATAARDWPMVRAETPFGVLDRPAILELDR